MPCVLHGYYKKTENIYVLVICTVLSVQMFVVTLFKTTVMQQQTLGCSAL